MKIAKLVAKNSEVKLKEAHVEFRVVDSHHPVMVSSGDMTGYIQPSNYTE